MNSGDEMNLVLENIEKTYGDQQILKGISLTFNKGEFNTIFGVSGSGKSTLLKIISGIEKPDTGKVYIETVDISNVQAEKRNIGFVFQKPLLFPHMTVRENIAFGLRVKFLKASTIDSKVNQLLTLLGIAELKDRYPHEISGGQQQRVAIGRALANEPRLLLMDEPFNGLDQKLRYEMGQLIKSIQKVYNLTIIFVTHDLDECLRLSDRIAILSEGTILQHDFSNVVYYQPNSVQVAELMGPGNWINGNVRNGIFTSRFGYLDTPEYADGKYVLFLRPHQLELTHHADGVNFKVKEIERIGKIQRIICEVSEETIILERIYVLEKQIDLTEYKLKLNITQVNLLAFVG